MMHDFLRNNRQDLIGRCRAKVLKRPHRQTTDAQVRTGVPLVLEQLIRTLLAESRDEQAASVQISGPTGGEGDSEIGSGASSHGRALLELEYTVDQVVHDYGDLCQAITELAIERDAPFTVDEYRTLNRCLDNAIAESVSAFSGQRDVLMAQRLASESNEKLGHLVHELRNALHTASLSFRALELGGLAVTGATGSVLRRSLTTMAALLDSRLVEVKVRGAEPLPVATCSLADLIDEAKAAAHLDAEARAVHFTADSVDPVLRVTAHRELLLGALANLLSNAFKFTHRHSTVRLRANVAGDRVLIDVADECGGLSDHTIRTMFAPFAQSSSDRTGLGLGLSIARANIEGMGGGLDVRNNPGIGCVFTVSLPNCTVDRRASGRAT